MSPAESWQNVLVVDDDQDLLFVASTLVEMLGYQVFTATSAEEAGTCLRLEKIDLVICDVNMPVTDGLSFFRAIQKELECTPPFVFMTGMDKVPLRPPFPPGVQACLQKPVRLNDIERIFEGDGRARSANFFVQH